MRLREYRLISQTVFFILSNLGFLSVTGLIYPFLYCYQCPTASASCPIGILEHAVATPLLLIYFFGFISLIGIVFGRLFCGWACPIGSLQDIIGFFRKKKFNASESPLANPRILIRFAHEYAAKLAVVDKKLRALKYVILILTVIISYITGLLAFTLVCPIGGLTATLPILAIEGGRYVLGEYFWYKIAFTIGFIVLIAAILRGFCRYICPFGALIAFFNRASIIHLKFNAEKCTQCKACASICPMGIDPTTPVRKSISIPVVSTAASLLFFVSVWNIISTESYSNLLLCSYIMLWLITVIAILAAVFFADILEISETTKNDYGRDTLCNRKCISGNSHGDLRNRRAIPYERTELRGNSVVIRVAECTECIRCFKCVEVCKEKAVQIGY